MNKQLVSMHFEPLRKILFLFSAVKTVQFVVIICTPAQFDVSSALLLQNYVHEKAILSTFHTPIPLLNRGLNKSAYIVLDRIVDRLVSWDAVYFADLFANGIQYEHHYFSVCPSSRGEWCDYKFPSLFAYAQSHYWGNGFFKYWTTNNVANFLFAAPIIALSGYSVRYFGQTYPVERVLPVSALNMVFLTSLLLFWHVQIITRIHTFLPVVYWLVAGLITQPNARHQRWARVVVTYFVGWNVLQTALFAAFLPPA
ncbi:hypothetical protein OXX80_008631 [Metschnikowia pulcherrima]